MTEEFSFRLRQICSIKSNKCKFLRLNPITLKLGNSRGHKNHTRLPIQHLLMMMEIQTDLVLLKSYLILNSHSFGDMKEVL